ncbi:MAG TPA: hypothetical protein VJM33_13125 [Microthrixaceae bacterium]|nr:hypothetical protein [Microthrixaceae bacterium]
MATTTKKSTPTAKPKWTSRAVLRDVEAGSTVDCSFCEERVKFQAKMRNRQVICNVYVRGAWDRVDHYHADCYEVAGQPHGPIVGPLDQRKSPGPQAMAAKTAQPAGAS